jgi:anti-sigma B factor antagonist
MTEDRKPLLEFRAEGRITVGTVQALSVLSTLNVAHFGKEALDYVHAHPGLNLLLDFTHVGYLSSVVLSELLRIKQAVYQVKGQLRLCGVSETIQEVFKITNLDRVFSIHGESSDIDVKRFERALEIAEEEDAWQGITE